MHLRLAGAIAAAGLLALPAAATAGEGDPCLTPSCEVAVAATRDGQLVLIDPTDGGTYGHLDHRPPPAGVDVRRSGPPIRSISLAPEGAYYSVVDDVTGTSHIWWRSFDRSGAPEWAAAGAAPAVSPDGRYLAYSLDPSGTTDAAGGATIAVRELVSGEVRLFPPAPEPQAVHSGASIDALTWSPDSTRIACHLRHAAGDEGEPDDGLHLLDLLGDPVPTTGGVVPDGGVVQVDVQDGYGSDLIVVRETSGALDRVWGQGAVHRLGSQYAAVSW